MYTFTIIPKPDAQVVRFFRDGQPMQNWRCALDDATVGQEAQRVVDRWNTPRIRILDLFCGAGGAAVGYYRAFTEAGYEVDITGVDCKPQPNYPYAMRVGDAMTWPLRGYDFIHASPPCQDHSTWNNVNKIAYGTGWMLAATRERLAQAGKPYIIENVAGASMPNAVTLCGQVFGLNVYRHRQFESNYFIYGAGVCKHSGKTLRSGGTVIGAYGHEYGTRQQWAEAMGIDWMATKSEIAQAIPPAYTHWLGRQIAAVLANTRQEAA